MEGLGIFGILILIADVYAILKIVKSAASDGKKAIWVVIVLILPILGLILWYLMGPGKPE
ncbi:MAG: PLDc N-terminal domain-containing protein [Woeseiaceae bacterium]|nr:PLDc N-terminal domain-containing protein [Woeseiaceae bacterium]